MDNHETLHAYLKESSMARHQSTETTMGGIGLSTLSGYVSFLRVQASGLDALQRALSPYQTDFIRLGISWADRHGAALEDLAALHADWQQMPEPKIENFAQALGTAYTLEGSRLGNAMMARQMKIDHPELAQKACAFLSYPTTPGFWREFTDKLNIAVPERDRWPDVLAGSLVGFDAFQRSAELELKHRAMIGADAVAE